MTWFFNDNAIGAPAGNPVNIVLMVAEMAAVEGAR
jgi:hypothetical protein